MKCHLAIISFLIVVYENNANFVKDYDTEYYSSSVQGLLKLLEVEDELVINLTGFADALQKKLETLQMTIDSAAHATEKGREEYISNPMRALGLIRRLRQDWPQLEIFTKAEVGKDQLETMTTLLDIVPTNEDMDASLLGISRIELTYDLNPMDVAEGRLRDMQFNTTFNTRDCLAIANHKYEIGDYARALIWYRIALKRQPEPNTELFGQPLDDAVRQNLFKTHMLLAMQILQASMNPEEAHEKVNDIFKTLSSTDLDSYVNELLNQDDDQLFMELQSMQPIATPEFVGCRGHFPKRHNLSCRYNFTTTPFLRLAPLKLEEINHDPYVVMYHNVIYDSEIEEMKRLSPQMQNGYIHGYKANQTKVTDIAARVNWLVENTPFLERMNQRITDMTGFDLKEFPSVQVANFGIGNNFEAHYDYIFGKRVRKEDVGDLGDRLASIIFYSSDVPLGGATVFPDIQVAVQPQKGNSLLWYNLFDDGTPDPRSLHSVCPVVVGSRWTLTKWLHTSPQMFIKRCTRPVK
ncbi:GH12091 [Drosophila grimshawi]|uniref:procollagen-proline 4-dioxygenase n=1 Tax=Drosophila grimshawi TaxID=7222 RepID=B4JZX3_DROGR|nr:GH12091 [Drosophila grimshawi]